MSTFMMALISCADRNWTMSKYGYESIFSKSKVSSAIYVIWIDGSRFVATSVSGHLERFLIRFDLALRTMELCLLLLLSHILCLVRGNVDASWSIVNEARLYGILASACMRQREHANWIRRSMHNIHKSIGNTANKWTQRKRSAVKTFKIQNYNIKCTQHR